MAVPVIMSFAAAGSAVAAAGGVIAAMGSFSGFLAVAGAALTGIGALTGKKDLVKVGGLMTLGSSLVGGLGGAAAGEAAGEAAGGAAGEQAAQEGFRALEHADAAGGADAATSEAWASGAGRGGDTLSAMGADGAAGTASNAGMQQATQSAAQAGASGEVIDPMQRANELFEASPNGASQSASPSIFDNAQEAFRRGEIADGSIYSRAIPPSGVTINGQVMSTGPGDTLANGARSMTSDQVDNLVQRGMRRTGSLLDNVGQWVRNNKELAQIGGNMLASVYDPQREALDFQRSIYARRMANLNRPVALTFGGG